VPLGLTEADTWRSNGFVLGYQYALGSEVSPGGARPLRELAQRRNLQPVALAKDSLQLLENDLRCLQYTWGHATREPVGNGAALTA
jgi:hypothetical protein